MQAVATHTPFLRARASVSSQLLLTRLNARRRICRSRLLARARICAAGRTLGPLGPALYVALTIRIEGVSALQHSKLL